MITYLLRRLVNYLILTVLATLFAYIAASSFFFPRRKYLVSSTPIPEEAIDARLDAVNMNDKVAGAHQDLAVDQRHCYQTVHGEAEPRPVRRLGGGPAR